MKTFSTWYDIPIDFEGHCYIKDDEGERWVKPGRKRHRVDGPAVIYKMGTQHWFYEDKKHRLDGPATIYATEEKEFAIHGSWLSEQEYWLHPLVIKHKLEQILCLKGENI